MPTNQQRREAERRRLQQQLAERRARQQARRRRTLITSVIGTVALIAAVVIVAVVWSSHKSTPTASKTSAAGAQPTTAAATTSAPSTSAAPSTSTPAAPTAPCTKATGKSVSVHGVTISGATDLKHGPKITSKATAAPPTLQCADLVVGTGAAARTTSTVSVRYTGVLYRNGTQFDSSWKSGSTPISFSLARVVAGFTQGIGGAGAVAPMRVGGRRLMILPSALGYGANPPPGSGIPPNAPLVFIVDLVKVTG